MLVFADESGDPGPAGRASASAFFSVGLVQFRAEADARHCEALLDKFRRNVGMPEHSELRFRKDSHPRRLAAIESLLGASFDVSAVSIDKRGRLLTMPGAFVEACAAGFLDLPGGPPARLVFDASGGKKYQQEVARALRLSLGERLSGAKAGRSHTDLLLQLADYVAGIANRVSEQRPGAQEYLRALGSRSAAFRIL